MFRLVLRSALIHSHNYTHTHSHSHTRAYMRLLGKKHALSIFVPLLLMESVAPASLHYAEMIDVCKGTKVGDTLLSLRNTPNTAEGLCLTNPLSSGLRSAGMAAEIYIRRQEQWHKPWLFWVSFHVPFNLMSC